MITADFIFNLACHGREPDGVSNNIMSGPLDIIHSKHVSSIFLALLSETSGA